MSDKGKKPIGIFDSGLGGLTVLKEIAGLLPSEDFIYFGDSKRAPYGTKSKETITNFAFQDVRFLLDMGVKALVVACNTISSNSIDEIREEFNLPVVEVIGPGARAGAAATKNNKVAVIGTPATVGSGAYVRRLHEIDSNIEVFQKSCPLFVPIVEEGEHLWNSSIARLAAEMYLEDILKTDADVLVLGCTHYPLLKEVISHVVGGKMKIVDSARSTASELGVMFKGTGQDETQRSRIRIFTSDSRDKFIPMSRAILGNDDFTVEQVNIEKY
ncbi:MAG TPA: glutamate racemase [Clostridia bacterium]|nr:glutamate racemase [Clostridia bacterium]